MRGLSDRQLARRYRTLSAAIEDDGDPAVRALELDLLAGEAVRRSPDSAGFRYDRGMYAKWRRDWAASREHSRAALDLVAEDARRDLPAAWNLGIAATALHDWPTARLAWTAFGLPLPDVSDDTVPIEADFGLTPVRLNADPRFVGEEPAVIDGRTWDTEVVWGSRLCPARAQITSVPLPESGHRFGDIVLHDGDPVGYRHLGEEKFAVFNEISLWERSTASTHTATVVAPDATAVEELADLMSAHGGAAEDWTTSVQLLCRCCSEGTARHEGDAPDQGAWETERHVGVAGEPAVVERLLGVWVDDGPSRAIRDLTVALR
ncbi:MAG: hypothetical protein QG622_2165 [Actinomycetota bacterium]|nr:hypothetical protein [Actinomycetota bacterium]